jgi:predicted nucleic acid-binding protein
LCGKTAVGILVVDASALGALIFGEPQAEEIASRLEGGTMVGPTLLWFELASICLKKIKAHPKLKEKLLQALGLAGRLTIQPIEVDQPEVVQLAWQKGLTTYDASYLWLVRRVRGELVTLDEKLKGRAKDMMSCHHSI